MAYNTIILQDHNSHVREEAVAASAITPGDLVTIGSAGTAAVAGADYLGVKMVAIEDAWQGKEITDAYAADDQVFMWIPRPGDIAYLTASAAIAIGDLVSHAASGQIVTQSTEVDVIGEALEAAAQAGDRIAVRIK